MTLTDVPGQRSQTTSRGIDSSEPGCSRGLFDIGSDYASHLDSFLGAMFDRTLAENDLVWLELLSTSGLPAALSPNWADLQLRTVISNPDLTTAQFLMEDLRLLGNAITKQADGLSLPRRIGFYIRLLPDGQRHQYQSLVQDLFGPTP